MQWKAKCNNLYMYAVEQSDIDGVLKGAEQNGVLPTLWGEVLKGRLMAKRNSIKALRFAMRDRGHASTFFAG